jgi:hypothetical protein
MERLDHPLTPGFWKIRKWSTSINDPDPTAPKFPDNGFMEEGDLIIMSAGDGVNLFWPNQDHMPCCIHYPVVPGSPAHFAGDNILCESVEPSFNEDTRELTVILTAGSKEGGVTGNTGTFVAQAVPPPADEPG